ncbi:hypothetical protein B0T26DRAFT_29331 [Lasiosphaeria miniovina]|uniref:Uncharacterized protein n=1 Tax=Lasiosphaeria miniovina TaxID=1954250 RepID=A0AA40ECU5_9PEZI|nr:uncharacterized protein B0T26DRAFT_29331 [Lasiosphaeria miniovina]KAK0733612.1 hypothetical protein B0T26DRAFT_29331 [Lasiosphaeria miniovina]
MLRSFIISIGISITSFLFHAIPVIVALRIFVVILYPHGPDEPLPPASLPAVRAGVNRSESKVNQVKIVSIHIHHGRK